MVIEADGNSAAEFTSELDVAQIASEQLVSAQPSGAIHIEFPGRAAISVERGADRALLRTILESLCR